MKYLFSASQDNFVSIYLQCVPLRFWLLFGIERTALAFTLNRVSLSAAGQELDKRALGGAR